MTASEAGPEKGVHRSRSGQAVPPAALRPRSGLRRGGGTPLALSPRRGPARGRRRVGERRSRRMRAHRRRLEISIGRLTPGGSLVGRGAVSTASMLDAPAAGNGRVQLALGPRGRSGWRPGRPRGSFPYDLNDVTGERGERGCVRGSDLTRPDHASGCGWRFGRASTKPSARSCPAFSARVVIDSGSAGST